MSAVARVTAGAARVIFHPEKLYAIAVFLALSGAFLPLLFGYADPAGKALSNPLGIQIVLTCIYLATAGLLFRMSVFRNVGLPVPPTLLLLLAFTAVSFAWSIEPDLTLKRLFPLLGATLVGIYFGARFTLRGFLKIAFVACFIMTTGSLLVGLLLPQYGIQPGSGLWAGLRGIFSNRNTLGPLATLAAVTSVYFVVINTGHDSTQVWMGVLALGIAMFCLVLTLSASSYITAIVALGAVPALRLLQRSGHLAFQLLVFILCLVAGGVALTLSYLPEVVELFGRDSTLTGRTDLWKSATYLIADRPWFGYGYAVAWDKLGWYFRKVHVHNGFLQVTLDTGLLGLGLCVLFLTQVASRCYSLVVRSSSFLSTFPAALFLLMVLGNVTEVNLMDGHSVQWCLLVFVAVQTNIEVQARKRQSGAPEYGVTGPGRARREPGNNLCAVRRCARLSDRRRCS